MLSSYPNTDSHVYVPRLVNMWVRGRHSVVILGARNPFVSDELDRETVRSFAEQLRKSADVLLEQLRAAGVPKESIDSALSEGDKQQLLEHLQRSHGTAPGDRKKITLTKKVAAGMDACRVHQRDEGGCDKVGTNKTDRVSKVIIVGSMGRSQIDDDFSESLIHAFRVVFRRFPQWHEAEALKAYAPRLEAIWKAVETGDVDSVLVALRQCFEGVKPELFSVLESVALGLASYSFGSISAVRVLIAWERRDAKRAPKKLKVGRIRVGNFAAASVAWRLKRSKRFLPACVATIALN